MRHAPVLFDEAVTDYSQSPTAALFLAAFSKRCIEAAEEPGRKEEGDSIAIHPLRHLGREGFLIQQGSLRAVVECEKPGAERDQPNDGPAFFPFTRKELFADAQRCARLVFDYFDGAHPT